MENNIKQKTLSNFLWRLAEKLGTQGFSFVVSIVLARILDPEVYGTIAIVTIFTTVLAVFVDSGLGTALIQKKDADDLDFSTVFYANIVFCIVLYALIFCCAPFIAAFYEIPELTPIVRVLSLTLVISGVKNIQVSYVSKKLMFKKFFWSTIFSTLASSIVGIYLAIKGYGVWALVTQNLVSSSVSTIVLWFTVGWKPKLLFSFNRFKSLFSYGWKLLTSSLIHTIYNDLRQLLIGKFYSTTDIAYFNKGSQLPNMLVSNINGSIDSVLLPVMSKSQDSKETVKSMTSRSISLSSYLLWPMMLGLVAVGQPLIKILLTDKWLPSFPYLAVFCISYALMPMQTANLNAIKALGRSDLYLKMEIIKKSVGILLVIVFVNVNAFALAFSTIISTVFASVVNAYPNKKLLGYSYFDQIKDILPSLLLSAVMAVIVYLIPVNLVNIYFSLFVKVIVGVLVYILGSILFKNKSFFYIKDTLLNFLKRK